MDAVALTPRDALEDPLKAPLSVHLDAYAPIPDKQVTLKEALEAGLAEERVEAVALILQDAQTSRIQLPHVADEMRGEPAQRIVALGLDDKVHALVDRF